MYVLSAPTQSFTLWAVLVREGGGGGRIKVVSRILLSLVLKIWMNTPLAPFFILPVCDA